MFLLGRRRILPQFRGAARCGVESRRNACHESAYTKDYLRVPIREQVEVLALVGDIALDKGKPKLHAHVVLGKRDAAACGGHLLEAHVRPTLEVILTESPSHLVRQHDPQSGLALIRL
jgi:predicted DNA-binding protein with PD1-like motif